MVENRALGAGYVGHLTLAAMGSVGKRRFFCWNGGKRKVYSYELHN